MAIEIPIISEFDGKGIKKAVAEFKQLEGAGAKAQYAIKKAAVPAAAALGGITALLGSAAKAAMDDAAAQTQMAYQVKNATGATDAQIASLEDWISAQGKLLGVADDELRPALSRLAHQTGSVEEAQRAATLAMDIAAAKGVSLETVTKALEKAYGGNYTALAKLDPGMRDAIKSGIDLEDALGMLEGRFSGSATAAANTAAGGMKRLKLSLDETKESIGAALLPVIEKALPKLNEFADWAQKNPELLTQVALAIGGISAAVVVLNAAMATNPLVLMAAGITALVMGFRKLADEMDKINKLGGLATRLVGWAVGLPEFLNILKYLPGGGSNGGSPAPGGITIPKMADGGIVTAPTIAMVGEAGPEAIIPLNRMDHGSTNVTINVNGGDPNAIVDTLRRYMRQSGALPISVY